MGCLLPLAGVPYAFCGRNSAKKSGGKILKLLRKSRSSGTGANVAVKYWQVENEPFLLTFGVCPALRRILEEEIALVKLDGEFLRKDGAAAPPHSGEFGFGYRRLKERTFFCTTMYSRLSGAGASAGSGYLK